MARLPHKERNKEVGRPRIHLNYKTLQELCEIQCTIEECAAVLGISLDALERILKRDGHGGFKEYFAQKGALGKMSLRRKQWQRAQEAESDTMLIWLGKQYLKQTDPSKNEIDLNLPKGGGVIVLPPSVPVGAPVSEALLEADKARTLQKESRTDV